METPELPPGAILQSRYRIVRKLGSGGFGRVYEAVDDSIDLPLALKETFYAADDDLRKAFEHEARTLARLSHDAFPRVSHYFTENDGCFLVMELIRGDDLDKLLKKQNAPFEQEKVLEWAEQILDALHYLHSEEIFHRDIKPSNLKLTPHKKVKILDLGIAKVKTGDAREEATMLAATPSYSPLEQLLRSKDDQWTKALLIGHKEKTEFFLQQRTNHLSDIYAVGATLYKLLTNTTPTHAAIRAMAIWTDGKDNLQPAHEVNPKVSVEVSEILQEAMNLYPEERVESAAEMRRKLKEVVNAEVSTKFLKKPLPQIGDDSDEQLTKARSGKNKLKSEKVISKNDRSDAKVANDMLDSKVEKGKSAALRDARKIDNKVKPKKESSTNWKSFVNLRLALNAVLIILVLSLLGAGGFYYFRDESFKTLTAKNTKNIALAVFSPDGNNIAGYGLGPISIWDGNGDNLQEVQIEQGCSGAKTVLLPERNLIASFTDKTIKICDTKSGNLKQTLAEKYEVRDLAFSPDGKTIASLSINTYSKKIDTWFWQEDKYEYYYDSTVKLWNYEDGSSKVIMNKPGAVIAIKFSPDGKIISILDYDGISLCDAANGNVKQFIRENRFLSTVVFSPDGQAIAVDGNADNEINLYNVAKGSLKQGFKYNNRMPGQKGDVSALAFSPDGNTIASYSDENLIRVWDIVNGRLRKSLAGHSDIKSLGFSPDSKTIISSNGETIKLWRAD